MRQVSILSCLLFVALIAVILKQTTTRPPHLKSYVLGKWIYEDDFSSDAHSPYQAYEFESNGKFVRTDHFAHHSWRIEGSFVVEDDHLLTLIFEKEGTLHGELKSINPLPALEYKLRCGLDEHGNLMMIRQHEVTNAGGDFDVPSRYFHR